MRPFESVPKHVSIELHSHCNRDCWFCPRWGDRSGKRKDASGAPVMRSMPTEKILELMQEVWDLGYRGNLNFHHLSEPFIDKRIIDFARKARGIGFTPIIHSNGDPLRNNPQLAKDAASVFSEITIGLYDYKNEAERLAEEEFWKNHLKGTPKLHFTRHEITFPRHGVDTSMPGMAELDKAIELAQHQPCEMVRDHLIIHYDGNVALCCEDYPDQFDVGNVFEKSLKDIWWSERRREVLEILSKAGGRLQFPHCVKCPFAPTQHKYSIAEAGSSVERNDNVYPLWVNKYDNKKQGVFFRILRKIVRGIGA